MEIYNGDCLEIFPKIEKYSVSFVLVDLPYGQTDCKWDTPIDLNKMWKQLKRILKPKAYIAFFCTVKFGHSLISSNPSWFRYDLVWQKSRVVGFLSANIAPLRNHEMIYIFGEQDGADLDNSRNLEMRAYAKKCKEYINLKNKQLTEKMGNRAAEHFIDRHATTQFELPTKKTYNKLIELFALDKMEGFIPLEALTFEKKINKYTYNPQMKKGEAYTAKGGKLRDGIYGEFEKKEIINKGTRHPTSILKFANPKKSIHPTQKPVDLCEYLIKTYTNKNDLVLDFTMGSGTVGIACLHTGRRFIGIEKDPEIFKVAEKRIKTEREIFTSEA